MKKRRASSSYILTTALICSALISQVTPSFGGAGSVLDSTDPLKAAPPLQTRALGTGDMTVASRTGAFEYSFPLSLPPGRLGSQPSIALSYSSQGALRGGLAAGWSLGLPEIHLEIPEGKRGEGRLRHDMFISSLSGGHRLIRAPFPFDVPLAGFDAAYRAQTDGAYTRYSMNIDPADRSTIVARTSDGSYYEFWNFRGTNHENSTRWPLHIVIDQYGNKTEYEYEYADRTRDNDTNVLVAITYGANENANLEDFARIEFHYNETETPCPGSTLITGASLTHRGPHTELHGSKTLDRIDVLAKPSPGASYLHSRSYELSYDEDAAACGENHGPLRILDGIQEHAPKLAGDSSIGYLHEDPTQWISKPQVSFGYGPLERSWNQSGTTGLTFLGRGGRVDKTSNIGRVGASMRPSLKDMLLDFNGDGYIDRLSSVKVNGETTTCQMQVHLGDGGPNALKTLPADADVDADAYSNVDIVNLPTLPWKLGPNPWLGDEDCSLSGQYTKYVTREGYENCGNLGAYYSYRFMDMDADGLPDLVTEIWSDPIWFAAWDEDSGIDISDLPPHTGTDTGECPLVPRESFLAAEVCPERDYCHFDQEMIQASIEKAYDDGDSVPCGVLYQQIRADLGFAGLPQIVDLLSDDGILQPPEVGGEDDPDFCPLTNRRGPEIRSGAYVWRWYKNTAGTLATTHNLTLSPIPLVANGGDSTLGHGNLSSGSAHGLYDITGDGFIDAISIFFDEHWSDLKYPPTPNAVRNINAWWVWPGDGKGGFELDPETGWAQPIAWHVPYRAATSAGLAKSFGNEADPAGAQYWVSGTTSVQDVNGDGLPDMLKQDPNDGGLRVYLNTGMGFRSRSTYLDPDLALSTVAWPYGSGIKHTSFAATTDTSGVGGPEGFLSDAIRKSRLMITDIDGDGLPDVYSKGTGSLADARPQRLYGASDARLLLAKNNPDDYPRRLMEADLAEWRLHNDLIDFNGDGVVDQIYGGTAGHPSSHRFQTDDFYGKPMRLLNHVNNGRGLTTEIRYAPGNGKSVAIDENNIKGIPNHTWVVETVSRSEDLGGGADNSPDTVVSVKYGDAVWNEDLYGHWGFRGFEAIETSAPHETTEAEGFAVTRQDYDFDLDYSGRLVGATVFVDGFPVHDGGDLVASIASTSWVSRSVASGSLSYVVVGEQSTVCADALGFVTESVCRGMPLSTETRTTHEYEYLHIGSNLARSISSPIKTWTSAIGGYVSDEQAGSLTQTTTMQLYADSDIYQLVATETNSFVGDGSTLVPIGRTLMNYSANGRELVSQESYRSASDSLPVTTLYGTDASTGNSTSTTKPEQINSGLSATQSFSGHQVYPSTTTNELGHAFISQHDVGTGKAIRTISPNRLDCGGWEGGETVYDGFGRPLRVYQYGCDTSGDYAPLLMQSFKYFEFDGNGPASVTMSTILGDTGKVLSKSYFDSYGRIVRTKTATDAGDSNVHYQYGANGKLERYDVPNPSLDNDNKRSEYIYQYDSLGRPTGMRVPDGSGVAPEPNQPAWDLGIGVDTHYGFESGLSTLTTIEIVQDGGSAGETKRYMLSS